MAKAVITILGLVGHTNRVAYIENNEIKYEFKPKKEEDKAKYYFSNELKDKFNSLESEKYINMLPLIIKNFSNEYDIKPIYTQTSKQRQQNLLNYEKIDFDIEKNGSFISEDIKDEKAKYSYFLNEINLLIKNHESVIVDVTHGFRHFPILATINLIIQNIQNPEKIEAIIFAKEIEQFKKYEIIDLIDYLELANFSYMLSIFNQNYTVSNISFKNEKYQELVEELRDFSIHFLSNSLKPLLNGKIIDNILKEFQKLKKTKDIENFNTFIDEIEEHLQEIKNLKNENDYIKLYKLSIIMNDRGYQLNAITLLFEAIGFYCVESFNQINIYKTELKRFQKDITNQKYPPHIYSEYTLTNESRTIVKKMDKFNTRNTNFIISDNMVKLILEFLYEIERNDFKEFQTLIFDMENLRNNLTHGNSGISIKNVKRKYKELLTKFEDICIEDNILAK